MNHTIYYSNKYFIIAKICIMKLQIYHDLFFDFQMVIFIILK